MSGATTRLARVTTVAMVARDAIVVVPSLAPSIALNIAATQNNGAWVAFAMLPIASVAGRFCPTALLVGKGFAAGTVVLLYCCTLVWIGDGRNARIMCLPIPSIFPAFHIGRQA